MEADILVVDSWLLDFNDIHPNDQIKVLNTVSISMSEVIVSRINPCICTAIKIEESNFSAKFDEKVRVWTASWKWLADHPPNKLTNWVSEYPMFTHIWQEYQ